MHPAIRIVCLILLALWLARGRMTDVLEGLGMVVCAYGVAWRLPQPSVWRMMWRLRAIIIPLLLLYGWMSPLAQGWQPDIDGVRLGMARVASLLIFVLAVHLVNLLTDAQHWVGALYWLAYPLQWLGIARERGAVRMHLVMQHLQALQLALEKPTTARHATFWLAIVARVEGGWQWAWARAQQPVAPFQLEVNAPPLWQWCVPLGMIGLLWLR